MTTGRGDQISRAKTMVSGREIIRAHSQNRGMKG